MFGDDVEPEQVGLVVPGADQHLGKPDGRFLLGHEEQQFVVGELLVQTVVVVPLLDRALDGVWRQRVRRLQRASGDGSNRVTVVRGCLTDVHVTRYDGHVH